VYATANHLKPEVYPNVEDNATMLLNYKDGVAILEASWDLPPRPPSGSEIFGRTGSMLMAGRRVEVRKAGPRPAGSSSSRGTQEPEELKIDPLPPERAEPIAYMVDRIRMKQPLEGMSGLDQNVAVNEILEAAKLSIKTGRAVTLPLK
jgi:predicted dehydrogenase